ncbi:MAG TPA: ribonuclease E/G [Acetobacteraceae bacterium]|nr:ribonuclease E/G [Acetobacteraceae bacterium]
MTTRILAAASPGEVRVAVLRGDDLLDYAIWRPGAPDGVGDLHRGRVSARAPALGGVFVALDGADGFLPDTEGGKTASEGTVLGVRVIRAAQGGKGPRLSARLSAEEQGVVGGGAPRLLRRGPGAVERLAAAHQQAPVWVDDPALAASLRAALGFRLAIRAPLFDDELLGQIDALAQPELVLPNGARLSFHPTPALVAIDVDTGAATGGHLAINRGLLPVLARQIRLRNLSGAILVDLAGLPARRRSALGPALAEALADDPGRPRLLGFTALGLAEIVRPRVHPPLHERLAGPHAAGLAALRAIADAVAADPSRMPALRAAPAVVSALEQDRAAVADLARRTGRGLIQRSDPSLAGDAWTMEAP